MTDARREAVARILLGDMCKTISERVTEILAWHDAETRALREAIANKLEEAACCTVALDLADEIRALLTPTPGVGKA